MILSDSLPGFKSFLSNLPIPFHWACHITAFVATFLFHRGPSMTATEAATFFRQHRRNVATLARFLKDIRYSPDLLVCMRAAALMLEAELARTGEFIFILDATKRHSQGQFKENSFSCGNTKRTPRKRRKGKGKRKQYKSNPSRCHNFICGLLLTPGGLRLPYCRAYYTKEYAEQIDKPFLTDAEIAAEMIRDLELPTTAQVIVVGDTAYDAEVIQKACAKRNFLWVVTANPERVLAEVPKTFRLTAAALANLSKAKVPAEVLAKLELLQDRLLNREQYVTEVEKALGQQQWQRWKKPLLKHGQEKRRKVRELQNELSSESFEPVRLSLNAEPHRLQRRMSAKRGEPGKYPNRTYWVHERIADIHSVGEVVLLFSKKRPPRLGEKVEADKILMSNALGVSRERLLHWYDLRWQIELLFKECKSVLGLDHYRVQKFVQVEGWVQLCLLSFCYLEWYRATQLQRTDLNKEERVDWERARTQRLCQLVRQQIEQEEVELMCQMMQSEQGRQELAAALRDSVSSNSRKAA